MYSLSLIAAFFTLLVVSNVFLTRPPRSQQAPVISSLRVAPNNPTFLLAFPYLLKFQPLSADHPSLSMKEMNLPPLTFYPLSLCPFSLAL